MKKFEPTSTLSVTANIFKLGQEDDIRFLTEKFKGEVMAARLDVGSKTLMISVPSANKDRYTQMLDEIGISHNG